MLSCDFSMLYPSQLLQSPVSNPTGFGLYYERLPLQCKPVTIDHVFTFTNRNGKWLSHGSLAKELCSTLQGRGLPADPYFAHSFRLGAATTAAAAGVPSWFIKVLGHWGSDCYELDFRTSQKHYLLSLRNLSLLILMLQFRSTIRSAWTLSALLSTCKFSPLAFPIYQQ